MTSGGRADERLRCAFVVQGEGRGHMTQALALERILRDRGHDVPVVFLGRSDRRPVPGFFLRSTAARVETFTSPALVTDRARRGVSARSTLLFNLLRVPRYAKSVVRLGRSLSEVDPDVAVNFFDVLGALSFGLFRPGRRRLAVGHHFLTSHPGFPRPDPPGVGWWGLRILTRLCGIGASQRLALSFDPMEDTDPGTSVLPPLLRRSVLDARPEGGRHLLVYVLNAGYARDLEEWHSSNRDVPVEAFWDRTDVPRVLQLHENLRFHRLDDHAFVDALRRCRGLATTAGFESVCEAAYLGKPVLLVPTEGHVEQACNAADAVRAGVAIRRDAFHLGDLLAYLSEGAGDETPPRGFRSWVRSAPARFLAHVEGSPPSQDAGSTDEN